MQLLKKQNTPKTKSSHGICNTSIGYLCSSLKRMWFVIFSKSTYMTYEVGMCSRLFPPRNSPWMLSTCAGHEELWCWVVRHRLQRDFETAWSERRLQPSKEDALNATPALSWKIGSYANNQSVNPPIIAGWPIVQQEFGTFWLRFEVTDFSKTFLAIWRKCHFEF